MFLVNKFSYFLLVFVFIDEFTNNRKKTGLSFTMSVRSSVKLSFSTQALIRMVHFSKKSSVDCALSQNVHL